MQCFPLEWLSDQYLLQLINTFKFPSRRQALRSLRQCSKKFYNLFNDNITEAKLQRRSNIINIKNITGFKNLKNLQKLEIACARNLFNLDFSFFLPAKQQLINLKSFKIIVDYDSDYDYDYDSGSEEKLLWILRWFNQIEIMSLEEFCLDGTADLPFPQNVLDQILYILEKNKLRKFQTSRYVFESCSSLKFDPDELREIMNVGPQQIVPMRNQVVFESLRSLILVGMFKIYNMELLRNLNLESFTLSHSIQLTDVELHQMIHVIRNLKSLKLIRCRLVTNEFFNELGPLKVTQLEITGQRFRLNWNQFSELHQLCLTLDTVKFNDKLHDFNIIKNLKHLELRNISETNYNEDLIHSISKLTQLTQLVYISNVEINQSLLTQIGYLPNLAELEIENAFALEYLLEGLVVRNQLIRLWLSFDKYISKKYLDSTLLQSQLQLLLTQLTSLEEFVSFGVFVSHGDDLQILDLVNLRYYDYLTRSFSEIFQF